MFNNLRALPRAVWLVGAISFVNDSASEMLYPLLPLYLTTVLMAGPRALGLIEGIAEATSSLFKLFSGIWIDRQHRGKPLIVWGYALAGFGRPLIALANSWSVVLVIRFADRLGKGLRSSPRDALLAGSVAPAHRGMAFGLHRAMDNAGAVAGPLMAALLLGLGFSLKTLFALALIPAVICLTMALALPEAEKPITEAASNTVLGSGWLSLPPVFQRYLLTVALFALGNSSNMFLLLRAHELGLPNAQVPIVWALVSAIAAIFSTPLSALSDKLGRVRLMVAGWLAYGLFYVGLAVLNPQHVGVIYALFGFYGIFVAATEGVEKALVADLAPKALVGTAFGWFNLLSGLMLLPASLIFGWLYEAIGPRVAFLASASCALLAVVLLLAWVRLPKQSTAL